MRAAVSVGFRKFRPTGGEPTLRLDLLEIVERMAKVPGVGELALTTNAILMRALADPLKAAGLSRVNVISTASTLTPSSAKCAAGHLRRSGKASKRARRWG